MISDLRALCANTCPPVHETRLVELHHDISSDSFVASLLWWLRVNQQGYVISP